jgi:hypothetical protein
VSQPRWLDIDLVLDFHAELANWIAAHIKPLDAPGIVP